MNNQHVLTKRKFIFTLSSLIFFLTVSCNKILDTKTYSIIENENFWETPEQIRSGVAPAYQNLRDLSDLTNLVLNMETTDEMIVPTRGADWGAGGIYLRIWQHKWQPSHPFFDPYWNAIFNGIGKCNFIYSIVNEIKPKPDNLEGINAELLTLRAYYYFLAMNNFGNVPIVRSFGVNPDTISNSSREEVYDFIVSDLQANIQSLPTRVDQSTYGRVTKWMAHALLAELYLNSEVYTGTPQWSKCIAQCDSILNSGNYQLEVNYFDNFSPNNDKSTENIFVVPFDVTKGVGFSWPIYPLHYQNQINFQSGRTGTNGPSATGEYYFSNFDTTSTYETQGGNKYRTFLDARTGQWLIGQQFSVPYPYPPYKDILIESGDASLKMKDQATGLLVSFDPKVKELSDASAEFRLAGVRGIKYFPEAGLFPYSNDWVIFRLGGVMLMKAEAEIRSGGNLINALDLINNIRERAYGNTDHDWDLSDLTLDNLLAERARELSWEGYRRTTLIRYEVASGLAYFGGARNPGKEVDPDDHYRIFPIPESVIQINPNLEQNPGY